MEGSSGQKPSPIHVLQGEPGGRKAMNTAEASLRLVLGGDVCVPFTECVSDSESVSEDNDPTVGGWIPCNLPIETGADPRSTLDLVTKPLCQMSLTNLPSNGSGP